MFYSPLLPDDPSWEDIEHRTSERGRDLKRRYSRYNVEIKRFNPAAFGATKRAWNGYITAGTGLAGNAARAIAIIRVTPDTVTVRESLGLRHGGQR